MWLPRQSLQGQPVQRVIAIANRLTVAQSAVDASDLMGPEPSNVRAVVATIDGRQSTLLFGEFNGRNRLGGYSGFKAFAMETVEYRGVFTLEMGGRSGLEVAFYSEDGAGDFDTRTDPGEAMMAGVSAEALSAMNDRYIPAAAKTIPNCMS
jgi:hypothetical protein